MGEDPRAYTRPPPGRRVIVGLVAAACILVLAAGGLVLGHFVRIRREADARAEKAKAPRSVSVVRVERTPERVTLRLPGKIHGFTETPVHAKVAGYLKTINVDKGDRVKAGTVLAELETPELDHQVRNAHATYELKRITDRRFAALRGQGVVSQQEADQAHADFLGAEATLRELEASQQYKRITADFYGEITARYVDPGALIPQATSGSLGVTTAIVAMASLDPVRVYVDLPQAEAPFVKDGDAAVVTTGEYPGRRFTGAVTRHPQALTPSTRTMLVEVDLANPDGALLPGMYAQVAIEIAHRATTPRVPDDALVFRDGRTLVPIVDHDRIRLVPVVLGYDDGSASEVTEGLSGDEVVAIGVGQTAREGEPVQVRQTTDGGPPR